MHNWEDETTCQTSPLRQVFSRITTFIAAKENDKTSKHTVHKYGGESSAEHRSCLGAPYDSLEEDVEDRKSFSGSSSKNSCVKRRDSSPKNSGSNNTRKLWEQDRTQL